MAQHYLFYDIETTGLSPCFDQVIQFAAILCNRSLDEIIRHEFNIQLNKDVIPSPEAMLTHQVPLELIQSGDNEYYAIRKIHQLLNAPNTTSVGYNTLGFDDEFLRFSFYRNLLTPYTHQYANGCGRMDIYPMAIMDYLFNKNSSIQWPMDEDGTIRLKLDRLNDLNQWVSGPSHTAIVDVEATIALARELKKNEKVWQYGLGYFDKRIASERILKLNGPTIAKTPTQLALMIEGRFGFANQFQHGAIHLGQHWHYKNQNIWLILDQNDFTSLGAAGIKEESWTIRKKINEPPMFLPLSDHYCQHLTQERYDLIQHNVNWLINNPEDFIDIRQHHLDYTHDKIDNIDVDASLYQHNFLKPYEQQAINAFHRMDPSNPFQWQDLQPNHVRERAIRILGRHFFNELDPAGKDNFDQYLKRIYFDSTDQQQHDWRSQSRRSRQEIIETIQQLKIDKQDSTNEMLILDQLEAYCDRLIETFKT